MIRHIVAWNFKEGFTESEKRAHSEKIKRELEALPQQIEGIVEISVHIDLLPSSTRSVMLNSLHESVDALQVYQAHPEHQKVGAYIGSVMQDRVCVDYVE